MKSKDFLSKWINGISKILSVVSVSHPGCDPEHLRGVSTSGMLLFSFFISRGSSAGCPCLQVLSWKAADSLQAQARLASTPVILITHWVVVCLCQSLYLCGPQCPQLINKAWDYKTSFLPPFPPSLLPSESKYLLSPTFRKRKKKIHTKFLK